jgi:protein translocase SecG subunit
VAASKLDPDQLAERAAAKALAPGYAAELPSGAYPVVMEPPAVGSLLELLGDTALNGLAYAEGRGALVDRLGEQVAAPAINLADSPQFRATLPRAFDAEGTPKQPIPLIQDGVARAVVHDLRSGALAGVPSTGHAPSPGGGEDGPRPTNLVLAGGGAAGPAELCTPIERGVYVTRFWYENVVRPKETLVTAVTRDGTFLIEDGRVTRPLRNLRLTDSVLGILSRVEDLSGGQELTSQAEFYGRRFAHGVVSPALEAILNGLQIILCVVLIVLILLHSGKDAGLSGAFGVGTGAGPFGGGSLVERNLNRWTVGFALVFVVNVILLLKI